MRQAVVDASVAVKWVVDEPLTAHALRARATYELLAPSLLHAEVASALTKGIARGEVEADGALRKMRGVVRTDVEIVPDEYLCVTAVQLAAELRHGVYDCFYLALAQARDVPLITADRRLAAAAKAAGVHAVPLENVG